MEKLQASLDKQGSTLNISVMNIEELKNLISKANKQVEELQKTIEQLTYFDLKFKFSEDNKKE